MPQPAQLDPSAFEAAGGDVGVLLIHGYTGSVAETRPMGTYLAERGLTVRCPLLPGHGTRSEDLTRISWQAWADAVEMALRDLQGQCDTVFVGGLSLGSLLTLWLGLEHPDIAGLIPMAPAIRVQTRLMPLALGLRYLFKYNPLGRWATMIWVTLRQSTGVGATMSYRCGVRARSTCSSGRVRRALPQIHQPILIIQGRRDAHLHPQAAEELYDAVASADRTVVWLEHSGHNLLIDGERESVWALSYDWMMGLLGGEST